MRTIEEHRSVENSCHKLPQEIVKKYELWKNIIFRHGPEKLREFPGFRDEKLKGSRQGQRYSRLSLHYRVIYRVKREIITVYVLEITPHRY